MCGISITVVVKEAFRMEETPSYFSLDGFIRHQQKLIEMEQEEDNHMNSIKVSKFTPKELEQQGVCLTGMVISEIRHGLFGHTICVLQHRKGKALVSNSFSPRDVVDLRRMAHEKVSSSMSLVYEEDKVSGIVYKVDETSIEVSFKQQSLDLQEDSVLYNIYKTTDTFTYNEWRNTLHSLGKALSDEEHIAHNVMNIQFQQKQVLQYDQPQLVKCNTSHLNQYQQHSLHSSLASPLTLIHGPPGTGKSTALVSIVENAVQQGKRVLITAASNIAVDQQLERVIKRTGSACCVRVGNSARVLAAVQPVLLDGMVSERTSAITKSDRVRALTLERGLQRLQNHAQENKGGEGGNFYDKIKQKEPNFQFTKEMNEMQREQRSLRKEQKTVDRATVKTILEESKVVACTLTLAPTLKVTDFDLVVIDEAAQAVEVACLAAVLRGRRQVLAGDHQQLPPTIQSTNSQDLSITLFERCIHEKDAVWLPRMHESVQECVVLLELQYRMNSNIMDWSSKQQYQSKLLAHESVATCLLSDTYKQDYAILSTPWIVLDTYGEVSEETVSGSKRNQQECNIVIQFLAFFHMLGIPPQSIGVISPYKAQVDLLKANIHSQDVSKLVEISTVDGFQGREKDIILISCVRSNEEGIVGFLNEKRRMNVAVTRAKRFVGIIGDIGTLCHDAFLQTMVDHRPQWVYGLDSMTVDEHNGLLFDTPVEVKKTPEAKPALDIVTQRLEQALEGKAKEAMKMKLNHIYLAMLYKSVELNSFERAMIHEHCDALMSKYDSKTTFYKKDYTGIQTYNNKDKFVSLIPEEFSAVDVGDGVYMHILHVSMPAEKKNGSFKSMCVGVQLLKMPVVATATEIKAVNKVVVEEITPEASKDDELNNTNNLMTDNAEKLDSFHSLQDDTPTIDEEVYDIPEYVENIFILVNYGRQRLLIPGTSSTSSEESLPFTEELPEHRYSVSYTDFLQRITAQTGIVPEHMKLIAKIKAIKSKEDVTAEFLNKKTSVDGVPVYGNFVLLGKPTIEPQTTITIDPTTSTLSIVEKQPIITTKNNKNSKQNKPLPPPPKPTAAQKKNTAPQPMPPMQHKPKVNRVGELSDTPPSTYAAQLVYGDKLHGATANPHKPDKGLKVSEKDVETQMKGKGDIDTLLDACIANNNADLCSYDSCRKSTPIGRNQCNYCCKCFCVNHGNPLFHGCEAHMRASKKPTVTAKEKKELQTKFDKAKAELENKKKKK